MVDYSALAAKATALIEKYGREMKFFKEVTAPADPNKPHRGGTTTTTVATVKAAIVDFKFHEIDGDHVRRGDKKLIAPFNETNDLSQFSYVLDGSTKWSIVAGLTVQPGETGIVTKLQVRR